MAWGIAVILWGAWVRISGSGAGCGEHWPLCQGSVIPSSTSSATWVEFTHRSSTAIFGLLVIGLVWRVFVDFPKKSLARSLAIYVLLFTTLEALIGAKLVLLSLVGTNESVWRAVIMAVHLLNTLLLLGSATLLAQVLRLGVSKLLFPTQFILGAIAFGLLAATGSIAALSNTLYPSTSLSEGLARDLSAEGTIIFQLRILHPLFALLLVAVVWLVANRVQNNPYRFKAVLVFALCFGVSTLVMLSPVWMKIVHLLITDCVWVLFIAGASGALFDVQRNQISGGLPS